MLLTASKAAAAAWAFLPQTAASWQAWHLPGSPHPESEVLGPVQHGVLDAGPHHRLGAPPYPHFVPA